MHMYYREQGVGGRRGHIEKLVYLDEIPSAVIAEISRNENSIHGCMQAKHKKAYKRDRT